MCSADGMARAGQASGLGQRAGPTFLPLPGKPKGYIYIYVYNVGFTGGGIYRGYVGTLVQKVEN